MTSSSALRAVVELTPRVFRVAALALVFAACQNDGDNPTGPSSTPTAVRLDGGNSQTATVGTALSTPLTVVVTDASGKRVSGARIDWDAGVGAGTASPSSSTTNSDGVAQTTWTLGTVSGPLRLTAQVNGLTPIVFTATAMPGPSASVVTTPHRVFLAQGDTIRLRATARDQFGTDVTGQTATFSALESGIATVSSSGLVTAVGQGDGRIVAAVGVRADTVTVSVGGPGSSVCGPLAARTLAVGEVYSPAADASGVSGCVTAPINNGGASSEYALTLISTAASFGTVTSVDVVAPGTNAPTTVALSSLVAEPSLDFARPTAADNIPLVVELERQAHARRELAPLVEEARAWRAERASFASLVAEPKVGDAITLNANANQACTSPNNRAARVVAVGAKSIVIADNENPSGGYTDAEYASVAATFDTLVYPLDTTAFGAPSNVSGYGKVILFYTRLVNALTPPSTSSYTIGGFFFARDLYPKVARSGFAACPSSNESEMFYLLVPDPDGVVNNNKRTKAEVTTLNLGTIAHEFEHLINAGRRLYVNTSATPNEETWLDEGLAHTAEELLFYRMTGYTSRQNLGLSHLQAQSTLFSNYGSQNLSRLYTFLVNPELNSPYAPNDSLATRGSTWSFLRFAAGRQGAAGEAPFYRALVNSTTTGRNNIQNVLGGATSFADYLSDWTVSLIADDFPPNTTASLDARYITPAWNFRSIYPGLRFGGSQPLGIYPLNTRTLRSGTPQRISLAGGTSSYLRFSLTGGSSTLISLTSNGAAPPSTMRYAIVRLR